ncbi:MAG TPA: ATP-binding protein [Ktedonobacteraceae bacterium]|jgi:PAS domain S-box-containing protein|nr:ATP-binding protein [Ktedonobacteraceae bacterium]
MFEAMAQQQVISLHMENPEAFSPERADSGKNYRFIHPGVRQGDLSGPQKEAAFHAHHQHLDKTLEALGLGVWCCDLPFKTLGWSNMCKRHFGLPPDAEVTIDIFYELLHPDDRQAAQQAIERSIAENGSFDIDCRTSGIDGHLRWIHTHGRCYDDNSRSKHFDGIIFDITEQKQVEQALREQIERLKVFDTRKDEFFSMASHELKSPITSLKGYTQMLQNRFRKIGDGQALYYLTIIDGQLNKLIDLVNDMLDISRIQTGKLNFRDALFDLGVVVRETVEHLQATTLTHHLVVEGLESVQVYGDKDRIGQVLINLLNNAIKYSPYANQVIVRLSTDQEYAEVSVQDFGLGIDEEHLEKVFERFYQVHSLANKESPGLGIGLYISDQIIKRHGGAMRVESKLGVGSTFSFTLPLSRKDIPSS